jgi:2-polyprenyl-3-methyl-5-hydroxy-6-metoxy-1,4-benzoquinol methylase
VSQSYYDSRQERELNLSDGCPLAEWLSGGNKDSSYAIHPAGFPIFLSPKEMYAMEAFALDPLTVMRGRDGPRHRNRFATISALVRRALSAGTVNQRVLDIGCCVGHLISGVRDAVPGVDYSALDCSQKAIEHAVRMYSGIDFLVANANHIPYPPHHFDGVICANVWEHLPDPVRCLREIWRVLRPGGFLVISTPSRYRLYNLLRVIRGAPVSLMSPNHVTEYSVGQVKDQLRFAGFDVKRVESRLVSDSIWEFRKLIGFGLIAPLLSLWIMATGSHHCLGDPAFFLASKPSD